MELKLIEAMNSEETWLMVGSKFEPRVLLTLKSIGDTFFSLAITKGLELLK